MSFHFSLYHFIVGPSIATLFTLLAIGRVVLFSKSSIQNCVLQLLLCVHYLQLVDLFFFQSLVFKTMSCNCCFVQKLEPLERTPTLIV